MPNLFTYSDAMEHALAWIGTDASDGARKDALRAIQSAYREFGTIRHWLYLYQRGRVNTFAPQTIGTIQYTNSNLQVTLTGATWPSWAQYGTLLIGTVSYKVASVQSSTVLTLSVNSNPGADVAAGTSYTIYQDVYPLPSDFSAIDQIINFSNFFLPHYEHPTDWLIRQRLTNSVATPRTYTILGDPYLVGSMAIAFYPPPDNIYTFDFIYHRRPRPLSIVEYKAGTVAGTGGASTLTGTSTVWTARHVGSVVRVGSDAINYPTGIVGAWPAADERIVIAVANNTSLTVDSPLSQSYAGNKYVISDPVDFEDGAMLTGFQRCLEKQTSITRQKDRQQQTNQEYRQALILAMEADSRNMATRVCGEEAPTRTRLAYMPRGADVS